MSITHAHPRRAPRHAVGRPRGEEVSIADALRGVPEQDIAAPVPTFTPHAPALTGPMPVLPEAAAPAAVEPDVFERLIDSLQNLDFTAVDEAQAVEGLTYADVIKSREVVPASCAYPEGVVRGLLIAALWNAARWYRDLDGAPCDDCGADTGWLCEAHIGYLASAMAYDELHDFAVAALTDEAALDRVTGACRAGTADVCDLGSPDSPLAAVLETALGLAGAEGGAR